MRELGNMSKKPAVLYKALVIGVIILIIGIGIQPVIASNVSNITKSDSEDDCNLCPSVSKRNSVRLKSIVNRLEKYDNILSVLSKRDPEIAVKYQKFSNTILNSNNELEYNLPIENNMSICDIIALIMFPILMFGSPFLELYDYSVENSKLLLLFISLVGIAVTNIFWLPTAIIYFYVFNCQ